MAKKKFSLEFEGMDELIEQFHELEVDIIPIATKALEATHAYITPQLHDKMQKSNLPAKGKYSNDQSVKQILDEPNIEWNGYKGSVDIGFGLDEGLTPIFLMYGGNYNAPVKGLKNVIYGKKTKEEIANIQEEIFTKELERVINGGG